MSGKIISFHYSRDLTAGPTDEEPNENEYFSNGTRDGLLEKINFVVSVLF